MICPTCGEFRRNSKAEFCGAVSYDRSLFVRLFVFFYPMHYLRTSVSCPSIVITRIRGHKAGSSPPSPLRFEPSFFIASKVRHFLPSSTRVELEYERAGNIRIPVLLYIACTAD
ncbi:unnamed protein product [Laminaria digitata]